MASDNQSGPLFFCPISAGPAAVLLAPRPDGSCLSLAPGSLGALSMVWACALRPPVERLESGYPVFCSVFSRGTLPKKGKRALLGDLVRLLVCYDRRLANQGFSNSFPASSCELQLGLGYKCRDG